MQDPSTSDVLDEALPLLNDTGAGLLAKQRAIMTEEPEISRAGDQVVKAAL